MVEYCYQLYSSRKFGPIRKTLRMLADLGYAGVESFGGLLFDAEFEEGLAETGLKVPTAHVALELVRDRPNEVMLRAQALGVRQIYVPYFVPPGDPNDSAAWRRLGKQLALAGEPFAEAGLGFGWHNHDTEFRICGDGTMPAECLLEADDRLLLEIDLAWVQKAGADPFRWIRHFGPRLGAAHIKDIAPEGANAEEDGWADVGFGVMDWAALSAGLAGTAAEFRIIEHDNPQDDRRFAENSLKAVRGEVS